MTEAQRRVLGVALIVIGAVVTLWDNIGLEMSGSAAVVAGIPLRFVGSAIFSVGIFVLLAGRLRLTK